MTRGDRTVIGKTTNQRAWLLVAPVVALVAFNALIPMMTVVNYSFQETFGDNVFFFEGFKWYQQVLTLGAVPRLLRAPARLHGGDPGHRDPPRRGHRPRDAAQRAVGFGLPRAHGACPLLIPWNVVGAMWNIFALPDIGLLGRAVNGMGIAYNFTQDPVSAWVTTVAMDVWHWTSLVVLLAYAGLCAIPDAYYQAAKIDGAGAWAVFRHIELPKMKRVLTIAIPAPLHGQLHDLHRALRADRRGTRQHDDLPVDRPGEGRARAVRPRAGRGDVADLLPDRAAGLLRPSSRSSCATRRSERCALQVAGAGDLHRVPAPADLLAAEHVVQRPPTRSWAPSRSGRRTSRWPTTGRSSPIRRGTAAT